MTNNPSTIQPKSWESLATPFRSFLNQPVHLAIIQTMDKAIEGRIYNKLNSTPTTAYLATTACRSMPFYLLMQILPTSLTHITLGGTALYTWQYLNSFNHTQCTKTLHAMALAILFDTTTSLNSHSYGRLLLNLGQGAIFVPLAIQSEKQLFKSSVPKPS